MKYTSKSVSESKKIAENLIKKHQKGAIICLYGDLGAGKTTFTKGLAKSLGIDEKTIKSPTFTILREYELNQGKLLHYDFYRQTELDPILLQQFQENQQKHNYLIIEWAERISENLPEQRIDVHIECGNQETERSITIKTYE